MNHTTAIRVSSRDNPALVQIRRLVRDPAAYRRLGAVWIEGEHLCRAAREQAVMPLSAVVTESAWDDPDVRELCLRARRVLVVSQSLFGELSSLDSPAALGFVVECPPSPDLDGRAASVVLDRVQDAGNVGSILRSAAAFGVRQVVALAGTASLWSPKVLRAAQGAHFSMRLLEGVAVAELAGRLAIPMVLTDVHHGVPLPEAMLPRPCAWVFGHEGQGVDRALVPLAALAVRIPQPGGQESLNVAAAAAVCLYESQRQQALAAAATGQW